MEMGEDLSSLEWRRSRSISRFICLFNLSLERSISLDDVVELDRIDGLVCSYRYPPRASLHRPLDSLSARRKNRIARQYCSFESLA